MNFNFVYILLFLGSCIFIPKFFVVVIIIIIIYFILKNYKNILPVKSDDTSVWDDYNKLLTNKQVENISVYQVYKAPDKLKYIFINTPLHKKLKQNLELLKFLKYYQPDIISDVVILIEKFLHIHYNVVIKKYDDSYIPILYDIKLEIIRLLNNVVYNTHNISTIVDIKNIDDYMFTIISSMDNILNSFIKYEK